MVAGVLENHIVITTDIEHIKVWVVDFPVSVPSTQSLSDRACSVVFEYFLLQQFSGVNHADVLTLDHLVTDAPTNDAGVVAVAHDHRTDILLIA